MNKYILVYCVDNYPEMGGGLYMELFMDEEALHCKVNELYAQPISIKWTLKFAGELKSEFTYEPKEVYTKMLPHKKQIT